MFHSRVNKISPRSEIKITTTSPIRKKAHQCYLKQPKPMLDLNISLINDENPHFVNALDRSSSHP